MLDIVEEGERRDAPRPHSQKPMEIGGAAKGKPGRRQRRGQFLEVDPAFLKHDRQPKPAFLVLKEQALAVRSRKGAAQCRRIRDGEDRRMRICPMRDPEFIETRKQFFRGHQRRRHPGAGCGAAAPEGKACKPFVPAII